MGIKIYGKGCIRCKKLEENVREALDNLDRNAKITKVTDINKIIEKGIMMTPALEINGRIVSAGKVLTSEEVKKFLK